MKREQDQRRLRGTEDKALLARGAKMLDRYLDLQLGLAKVLTEIQEKRAYVPDGASSLGHWVSRSGCDDHDAWRLHRIGSALEHHRGLEKKVRGLKVPLRSAESLGRTVLAQRRADVRADMRAEARVDAAKTRAAASSEKADGQASTMGKVNGKASGETHGRAEPSKAVVTSDADLLKQAETQPADAFRRAIDAEVESRSTGMSRRERVQVHTSKGGAATFRRACQLASRSLGRSLTPGQAFDEVNREYVSRHESDTPGLGTRKRKLGKTSDDPKNRRVPAEVKAEIFRRAGGDCCEVPGCTNRVYLQWAHGLQSNAAGGGQETWNTLRLCSAHHTQFDKLVLTLFGWTKDGRPVLANAEGLVRMPGEHGRLRRRGRGGNVSRLHPSDPRRRKRGSDPPGA